VKRGTSKEGRRLADPWKLVVTEVFRSNAMMVTITAITPSLKASRWPMCGRPVLSRVAPEHDRVPGRVEAVRKAMATPGTRVMPAINPGGFEVSMAPLDELVDSFGLAFDSYFHAAIGEVACPPGDTEGVGPLGAAAAVPDSLHPPADPEVPADHSQKAIPLSSG